MFCLYVSSSFGAICSLMQPPNSKYGLARTLSCNRPRPSRTSFSDASRPHNRSGALWERKSVTNTWMAPCSWLISKERKATLLKKKAIVSSTKAEFSERHTLEVRAHHCLILRNEGHQNCIKSFFSLGLGPAEPEVIRLSGGRDNVAPKGSRRTNLHESSIKSQIKAYIRRSLGAGRPPSSVPPPGANPLKPIQTLCTYLSMPERCCLSRAGVIDGWRDLVYRLLYGAANPKHTCRVLLYFHFSVLIPNQLSVFSVLLPSSPV